MNCEGIKVDLGSRNMKTLQWWKERLYLKEWTRCELEIKGRVDFVFSLYGKGRVDFVFSLYGKGRVDFVFSLYGKARVDFVFSLYGKARVDFVFSLYGKWIHLSDIDECTLGTHQCDQNAACSNNIGAYTCTCNPGFNGNGVVCSSPARFETHPISAEVSNYSQVHLSCSYNNYTAVSFHWKKDDSVLDISIITNSTATTESSSGTGIFSGSTNMTHRLSFRILRAEEQGFYWCSVLDSFNRIVDSIKANIRLTDVSSTMLSLKVEQPFSSLLLDRTTDEYVWFEGNVTTAVKTAFSKKGLTDQSKIVLQNIRQGSVLVDVFVYYSNIDTVKRTNVCGKSIQLVPADFSTSTFVVSTSSVTSYDCCFAESTGDAEIKGVISWPDTAYGHTANLTCPYNRNILYTATRICKGFGLSKPPQWQTPNNDQCPYKTKTTQQLSELAQGAINVTNVVETAAKLNNLTKSPELLTNNLDVKFSVETVNKIVDSQQSLDQIIEDVINVTNNLMDAQESIIVDSQQKHGTSEQLLNAVQKLADEIPLANKTKSFTASKKNIALGIVVVDTTLADGFSIQGYISTSGYNNVTLRQSSQPTYQSNSVANIFLPASLLRANSGSQTRVSSFLYDNFKLFVTSLNQSATKVIDSKVMSTSIKGKSVQNLNESEEVQSYFQPLNQSLTGSVSCVYWNFTRSEWASNGCRFVGEVDGFRRCRCNHLTNFAILMNVVGGRITEQEKLALSYITYIGCGISLFLLFVMVVTFLVFRKQLLKTSPARIHLCLAISIIGSLIFLLLGMQASNKEQCQASAVLVHYFVLSSFLWMASEAYNLYQHFIKVFNIYRHHMVRRMCLISWGVPLVVVGITAGATKLEDYTFKNGSEWICMVRNTPFYVAYLAPILLVIICNLVVMCLSFKKIFRKSEVSSKQQLAAGKKLRIVLTCSVLMGTTWVLGVFAFGELTFTFQLLFTIFNSLQGTFIFVFYCLLNKDAQNEWKRVFGCAERTYITSSGVVSSGGHVRKKSEKRARKEKIKDSDNADDTVKGSTQVTELSKGKDVIFSNVFQSTPSTDDLHVDDSIKSPKEDKPREITDSQGDEVDSTVFYHMSLEKPSASPAKAASTLAVESEEKNIPIRSTVGPDNEEEDIVVACRMDSEDEENVIDNETVSDLDIAVEVTFDNESHISEVAEDDLQEIYVQDDLQQGLFFGKEFFDNNEDTDEKEDNHRESTVEKDSEDDSQEEKMKEDNGQHEAKKQDVADRASSLKEPTSPGNSMFFRSNWSYKY
ncbi:adhesion G-protein coupled receptor G4-like [Rhopilema esculentum]|uniref:adhesion G-protein coupled receptor G4-like n=1 Tax=Rhopilema esculentum TaxID=499914 RepID=UPI0031D8D358